MVKLFCFCLSIVITLGISGCNFISNNNNKTSKEPEVAKQNLETPIIENTPNMEQISPEPNGIITESPGVINDTTLGDLPDKEFRSTNIVSDKEYHYFYVDTSNIDDGSFYRSRKDGSYITKISNNYPAFINCDQNWIYFVKVSNYSREGPIVKIDKNGDNRSVIFSGNAQDLILLGNWLYFYQGERLCKIYKDGSSLIELGVSGVSLQYDNNSLYYIVYDDNYEARLEKFDLLSNKKQIIANDFKIKHAGKYIVYGAYIYYLSNIDQCIYKMDNGGYSEKIIEFFSEEDKELFNGIDFSFNIYNKEIYLPRDDSISVYDLEGVYKRDICIKSFSYNNIISSFADDFIYYWQYVPESSEIFMRVKNDGTEQEFLMINENGILGRPDWWQD